MNKLTLVTAAFCICLCFRSAGATIVLTLPLGSSAKRLQDGPGMKRELQKTIELFKVGKTTECLDLLSSMTSKHSFLPPPRLMLARLYLASNQPGRGRALLEEAAEQNRTHPEVYIVFAELALREGRFTDALLHYEKTASLSPLPVWDAGQTRYVQIQTSAGRAVVAEQREDWQAAERALSSWLELEPASDSATACSNSGKLKKRTRR